MTKHFEISMFTPNHDGSFAPSDDRLDLWKIEPDFFVGIVIDDVSPREALKITNQVGGTACAHPEVDGIAVKLPADWLYDTCPLRDLWPLEKYDVERVQSFLDKHELTEHFIPLDPADAPKSKDGDGFMALAEAWVPVRVRRGQSYKPLHQFEGQRMILTYTNSD